MNRLANRVLKFAAVAAVCGVAAVVSAADWTYDSSNGQLTEVVTDGATPWVLRTYAGTTSGLALGTGTESYKYNAVITQGTHSVLDLSGSVRDANGTVYAITELGRHSFRANTFITGVKLPETLEQIIVAAFMGCSNLETIEPFVPDSVNYIGWAAFNGCAKLQGGFVARNANLEMQNGGDNLGIFVGCNVLTNADFSMSGLTVFPRCCFYTCAELLQVKLPKSYAEFSNAAAFGNCPKLREVSFLSCPNTSIPGDTLKGSLGMSNGARITYPANNSAWDAFARSSSFTAWDNATSYQAKYRELWPEGPQPIGYASIGGQWMWMVPIAEEIADCRLTIGGIDTSGAPINIGTVSPDYCESRVVTEDSVVCTAEEFTTSGDYGYQCLGYQIGKLKGAEVVFGDMIAGREYTFVKSEPGEYYLRWIWERQAAKVTVAEFPEEFGEVSVSGTNYHGYDGYYAYDAEVTFTATPKGEVAFGSWCGDVPEVQRTRNPATVVMGTAPRTVTPYFSKKWVFDDKLTSLDDGYWTVSVSGDRDALTIKGATQKGTVTVLDFTKGIEDGGTFKTVQSSCLKTTPATDVLFPDSIETIGERVFENNKAIERVRLPFGLKRIEIATFDECSSLKSVVPFLPKTIEYIGWAAFDNCSLLTNDLVLSNKKLEMATSASQNNSEFENCGFANADLTACGLTNLPRSIFIYCSKLKCVKMPKGLRSLGSPAAVHYCTALEDVQFQSYPDMEHYSGDMFTRTPAMPNSRIVYPKGDPDWAAYIETRKQAKQFTAWEDAKPSDTNAYFETFKDGWKPIGYTSFSNINKWLVPHNFNAGMTILFR